MKKSLLGKFLLWYLLIGIVGTIVIAGIGSYMIDNRLEQAVSERLYEEATAMAASDTVKQQISQSDLSSLQTEFSSIASFQKISIWILNTKGEIVYSTDQDITADTPVILTDFDPTQWGNTYYQVGDFFGYFQEPTMSVIAPITANLGTSGYVVIHQLMQDVYARRSSTIQIMYVVFGILYAAVLFLPLLFQYYINRPLGEISKGAREFAAGNLSYRISVDSDNEFGYLSQTLNDMAERLYKVEEYQRKFVANVSHDFRSPLTSIKGYVEAILDGTIPPQMQERYLKIIAHESERLEKLTQNLLTLNEIDTQKRLLCLTTFDINQVIKTTAATFEGICTERKIRLELILSGVHLLAVADMDQIQQILYNLLDNAIKFSPDHSSVILETTEKSGRIFVSVKDFGVGIRREDLARIWDRFYKTDSSRGKDRSGTGLGLSIVKEIIHAHGQNIDVISTPGAGTEFIFTLDTAVLPQDK